MSDPKTGFQMLVELAELFPTKNAYVRFLEDQIALAYKDCLATVEEFKMGASDKYRADNATYRCLTFIKIQQNEILRLGREMDCGREIEGEANVSEPKLKPKKGPESLA